MRAGRYVAGATAALAVIAALVVLACAPLPTYQYQYVWHDAPLDPVSGDWCLVGGHHGAGCSPTRTSATAK